MLNYKNSIRPTEPKYTQALYFSNSKCSFLDYLFILSIAVCFEAFRSVELDCGAADHLDAALGVVRAQGSHTAVHLYTKYY